MDKATILQIIKEHLPQLLREDERFRYEIKGLLAETFSSKEEFQAVLEEVRALREDTNRRFEEVNRRFEETNQRIEALREDTNRRFEEVNRRFEEMNRRFDHQDDQIHQIRLELSAISGRLGRGMEEVIRRTIERFSGRHFREVKRLVLEDEEGEVFGTGAQVEFDAYLEDTDSFVVEVKTHIRTDDVYTLKKKVEYAQRKLQKSLNPVVISSSIDQRAKRLCDELGIQVISRSVL
ncbi:MAG TPA: DUF3782 domain-containing protein [Candidatus Limnocylindrales bacterium]|nr:DUF3782 domain-containing protein [Candidatus Limnocylindrales bacterium]